MPVFHLNHHNLTSGKSLLPPRLLATATLSPLDDVPMRAKVLTLDIVDVAAMAAVTSSDAVRDQVLRDYFKKLEDMKVPKF